MPAIGFSRQHVHELAASSYQSRQFGLFFRGFLRQSRPDLLGETRQEQGIDAIGFGEFANGSCEVANLAGIHHRNRLAGVDKFRGQATLQAAGRLKDNHAGRKSLKRSMSCAIPSVSCDTEKTSSDGKMPTSKDFFETLIPVNERVGRTISIIVEALSCVCELADVLVRLWRLSGLVLRSRRGSRFVTVLERPGHD